MTKLSILNLVPKYKDETKRDVFEILEDIVNNN